MDLASDPLAPWVHRRDMALMTDLYELTMVTGYFKNGIHDRRVCFEHFFRSLPGEAGFAVFAGLEPALEGLATMRFSDSDLAYLRDEVGFDEEILDFLAGHELNLDVWAMPEGTLAFPHEPMLRIEGSLLDAQLVETFLLNTVNFETLIATKAARICLAADGDPVLEFGLRRAQGPDGGLSASRAAYIGGCAGTSNVLAGKFFGIPVRGTHAHSWVMSHESELEAFRAYARVFPDNSVLLVDTYDTLESGVPNAIKAFSELRKENPRVRAAIRLDSGDLAKLSKRAHAMLLEAGFKDPLIVASSDLDEVLIADLKRQGAKINSWGVGTKLVTGFDQPALGGVYKLVSVFENGEWCPRIKVSGNPEKTTDPGRKQVYRLTGKGGQPLADLLCHVDHAVPESGEIIGVDRDRFYRTYKHDVERAEPLLAKVMENGKRLVEPPPLAEVRARAQKSIAALEEEKKRLKNPDVYRVLLCPELAATKERLLKERSEG